MTEARWMKMIGDNLHSMLHEEDMSQRELAESSGLSEAAISNYIRGKRIPSALALLHMAYALDCSIDDLIDFGERIT